MSTNRQLWTMHDMDPINAPQLDGCRRIDHIDEATRPLGEKRAAFHAQRQRSAAAAGRADPKAVPREGERVVATKDASIAFKIRPTSSGLLIERTQREAVGPCLVQTLSFQDAGWFDRWCDSEPVRFEEPVVYDQLRREGHEALGSKR